MKGKWVLWAALIVSLFYCNAWQLMIDRFDVHIWHPCCAFFIFLICLFVFLNFRSSFIAFLLMAYSLNNLADELLFDPAELHINEVVFAFAAPTIWFLKRNKHDRERAKRMG